MVAGFWYNNDGLPLQYGTQKAIPEMGGDYLAYGELRVIEQYIPLCATQWGTTSVNQVPGLTGSAFAGNVTAPATALISAGIQSLTTLFPLAQVAPTTTASSSLQTFTAPQVFIEQVEVECLITAAPTTNTLSVGLVVTNPTNVPSVFSQLTSSIGAAGTQILNVMPLNASTATAGSKTIYCGAPQGFTFPQGGAPVATATGGGTWVGIFSPIPTNAITPLPQAAWLSSISSGVFTQGLLKLRVKYYEVGNINY